MVAYIGMLIAILYFYFIGISLAPWTLWMASALGFTRNMSSAVARSAFDYFPRHEAAFEEQTSKIFNSRYHQHFQINVLQVG
jgi:hypothetical protein